MTTIKDNSIVAWIDSDTLAIGMYHGHPYSRLKKLFGNIAKETAKGYDDIKRLGFIDSTGCIQDYNSAVTFVNLVTGDYVVVQTGDLVILGIAGNDYYIDSGVFFFGGKAGHQLLQKATKERRIGYIDDKDDIFKLKIQ